MEQTASLLGDQDVPDQAPDHDWTARFFNYIQDISSEEMQLLWAKVLAGQIEQPGSVSIKALSTLRNLDQDSAKLFQMLCSACIVVTLDGLNILDARVPSLGRNAGENSLQDFGLWFSNLNTLNEHGLIISDYNSWFDMRMCIGIPKPSSGQSLLVNSTPFRFQKKYWVLTPSDQWVVENEYKVHGVAFTQVGKELSKIVECIAMPAYHQALVDFFLSQNLMMIKVNGL